jgi:hypothetical protein
LARGARKVEEEEELDEGGGGGGAEMTTGGAAPADGGQPERVRSDAEEVETFPRGKERSGETAGTGERRHRCKDVGMSPRKGRHPMRKDDRRNRCRNMIRKGVGPISLVGGEERGT